MKGFASPPKKDHPTKAQILGRACIIAGFTLAPTNAASYDHEEHGENYLNEGKGTNAEDTRFRGLQETSTFYKGQDEYKNISLPEEKGISFFQQVNSLAMSAKISLAKISSLLKVERKSIYDWKNNPDVNVRASTRERLDILDDFLQSINSDHRSIVLRYSLKKVSHAIPSVEDDMAKFREAIFSDNLSQETLCQAYDKIWDEIEKQRFLSSIKKERHMRS